MPKLIIKEALNKSFDKLRTNGRDMVPFVVTRCSPSW